MGNPFSWTLNQIKSLKDAVWHARLSEISRRKSFVIKQLRIIIIAVRGFINDKVETRASALTFYSLLSIIPAAAIAFAIAKGFGLDQNLEQVVAKEFQAHQEVLNWLLTNARSAIQETRGGYIAGVGLIILFWSVIALLANIENSFNHIWQIRTSRPWFRKFTNYITIMLIAPVFIVLSSSITLFVSTQLSEYMTTAPILEFFKPVISFLVRFTPYFLSWIILTLIFIVIPNTKVRFMPAFVSGIVAGTILQILQWLYIDLQFGITKLSAIYGSFAAIPLFIIWLQSSWIIVLLGAELSFAYQNLSQYEFEAEALNISNYQKKVIMLMIMHMITRNFSIGEKPLSAENIVASLKIPVRLARDILQDLSNANLVSEIQVSRNEERFYQPAIDINKMTISYILSKLDKKGAEQRSIARNKDYNKIVSVLDKFEKMIAKSDSNVSVRNLL